MLALFILALLLVAGHSSASKSANACCSPVASSFVRISPNKPSNTLEDDITETVFSGTVSSGTCPVINGIQGVPVCTLIVGSPQPVDLSLLDDNIACPYLSPANVNLQEGSFVCAGYVAPSITFSCAAGATPQCRYHDIPDVVIDVSINEDCVNLSNTELTCAQTVPGDSSLCPATSLFNGISYPLSASLCDTGAVSTFATPYATLLLQFLCNDTLAKRVVDQLAGCYLGTSGALCPDGTTSASCYYAVPKPASY